MFSARASLFAATFAAIAQADAAAVASGEDVCSEDASSAGCGKNNAEESEVWNLLQTTRGFRKLEVGQERVEDGSVMTIPGRTFGTLGHDCGDTNDGATDSPYNKGCDYYAADPYWCGKYDDADFSSYSMCCGCGGGKDLTCDDTNDGATDYPYNKGCDYYAADPYWCGKFDDADFSSYSMCCGCGGGKDLTCDDTNGGAEDSYGGGCDYYKYNPQDCGGHYDDADFTSTSMCCACGGGHANSNEKHTLLQKATTRGGGYCWVESDCPENHACVKHFIGSGNCRKLPSAPSNPPATSSSRDTPTLTSVGSKANTPKEGIWTVTPTNGVIQSPAPFKPDGGGPYWAASCCDGPNKQCGEQNLNLENKYKLVSATLVKGGWLTACTVNCMFSDGATKTFSTEGAFPSSCVGANEVRLKGGGHCGRCYFQDIKVTPV